MTSSENEELYTKDELIQMSEQVIHNTLKVMEKTPEDDPEFQRAVEAHRGAEELWLQVAQGMSPEKARAVIIGFAFGELRKWMDERRPGPPPTVLDLYK